MTEEIKETETSVKDLMPMDEIRKMVAHSVEKIPTETFGTQMDKQFNEFLSTDDEKVKEEVKKHNQKTFKLFKKRRETINSDVTATEIYQTRYDRETWYYKRHKDTIDKYVKKEDKQKTNTKNADTIIVEQQDEALRIGIIKMWIIVWYDLLICTVLGNLIMSPIHLFRFATELFYKMKKSIAISVLIITIVILIGVGLIFGINALMRYAQSLS